MKRLMLLFWPALLLTGCQKESIFDEYGFYGEGTAWLNGNPWNGITGVFRAKRFCEPDTCVAVKLLYINQSGALRGDITLDFIPLQTGKYALGYTSPTWEDVRYKLTYSTWASDGDVLTGIYDIFEQNDENYVEITELNRKTGDIKGRFQAVVVRDSLWTLSGATPDTIRITDGSFYGRIFWQ